MLNTIKTIAASTVLIALMGGCAQTATELEFGNAARAVAAGQTMNPEGTAAGPDVGDGIRLEKVVNGYRETTGRRALVSDDVRLGVSGGGESR